MADTPAPSAKRPVGFFSTDNAVGSEGGDFKTWLNNLSDRAFPRTTLNLKAVTTEVVEDGGTRYAMDASTTAMDASEWSGNSVKGIYSLEGYGMSEAQAAWYAAQGFIGYQMCAVLAQQWLVDKACTMPARDATRSGYEITVNNGTQIEPEVLDEMRKLDKRFKITATAREFVRNCRIFGIRIALFKVDSVDPDYYLKPFNPDGVTPGSYKGISQVDPYWITPELDGDAAANPASIHFYEPTFWRINGKRYHRSHLVIIKTCEVADVLKPTYFYGGVPLPQRIYERIYAAERTANEAPQLALTKRLLTLKVDLAAATATQGKLEKNLENFASLRDNYGVKVVGGDEEISQTDTSLSDMDALIMTQYQLVAAIAEVPATKLLGTTPKGFQSTGEYEEANYHEFLESIQEHDVRPLVERHHLLCVRSYIAPQFGIPVFETTITFNELDAETAAEKSDRQLKDSTTAKNYSDAGAVDGVDIRNKLIADPDSGYSGMDPALPEDATKGDGTTVPHA